jgi:hypothetical protein
VALLAGLPAATARPASSSLKNFTPEGKQMIAPDIDIMPTIRDLASGDGAALACVQGNPEIKRRVVEWLDGEEAYTREMGRRFAEQQERAAAERREFDQLSAQWRHQDRAWRAQCLAWEIINREEAAARQKGAR